MRVSVVVPVFKGGETLKDCLDSVFSSSYKHFEVIVVDDCSMDDTADIAQKYDCQIIKLQKNKGVANARNVGVEYAKSDLIVFVDADVMIYPDTLKEMVEKYKSEQGRVIIGASQSKKYLANTFGAKFNALKDYYAVGWKQNETKRRYYHLQTPCCLIEKTAFNSVGGFNTKYKSVGIEDFELGYRLTKKGYKMICYKNILFDHYEIKLHHRNRALMKRAALYLPLFLKRQRFEPGGATGTFSESLITLLTFFMFLSLFLSLLSSTLLVMPLVIFIIFILLNSGLIIYFTKEEGLIFTLLCGPALIYRYLAIASGIFLGVMRILVGK